MGTIHADMTIIELEFLLAKERDEFGKKECKLKTEIATLDNIASEAETDYLRMKSKAERLAAFVRALKETKYGYQPVTIKGLCDKALSEFEGKEK